MANPLEKDSVDGSARAWMGGVEVVLILMMVVVVVVVVVVMREVTTMVTIAILIVVTSCPGWRERWWIKESSHLAAHPHLLHPLRWG